MKLHELHINDFKFFSEVEPASPLLKIDGNHLLIYGENGSGKSTIYWALYTLLESSLKKDDDDIRKYFKKTGNDSLVNIHASSARNNSFIKVVLKDDDGNNPKTFRISRKSRDLSIRNNVDVVKSSMATDFINYRVLFQLHNLKHSKDNDLWLWFEEEVLPYVKKRSFTLFKRIRRIKKGTRKN
ncbi:MAG: AAA family ATPase [Bacteroidetes bacterium]|jgi:recombinational DNA repair ATPase RecF|nr:AAA family ATPase [Bacteroidota bacterium]MBT6687951.1 AAA family ATPase [Bacteroidota bacterium]MBT7143290.1 AAA family ATPase [Bacteroidota bacterium]MBT7490271.1 AAA family ATPase [Bacteroidota bacterium]